MIPAGRSTGRRGAAGRAVRPHPVLRLALSVLRLRRLRRRRGARAAGRASGRSSTRSTPSSSCAPTRSTRGSGRDRPSARDRLPRRRNAVAAARRRGRRRCWRGSASGSGSAAAPRSRSKPIPDPTSAATPGAWRAAGVTRLSLGRPDRCPTPELRRLGRRHRAGGRRDGGRARPATPGSRSISLDLLYDVPGLDRGDLGRDPGGRARARARPPVAVRADPRRSRRRGPHRADRRSPADERRALAAGGRARRTRQDEDRAAAQYRHATDAWRRPAGAATRSATGRDPATRAGTTWSTGSGGRTRRSAPARTRSTASTRRWNAARLDGYLGGAGARRRRDARSPAGRLGDRSMRRPPPPRRSSSALRTDRGIRPPRSPRSGPWRDVRVGRDERSRRRRATVARSPDDARTAALERALRPARLTSR